MRVRLQGTHRIVFCADPAVFAAGLNAWFAEGLAGEGEEEAWTPSGRTPSSARAAPPRPTRQ
jgi:hypothetical protein